MCEEMALQLNTSQEFSCKTMKSLKQFNLCLVLVLFYISNYFLPFAKNSVNLIFEKMKNDEKTVMGTCSHHGMSNNLVV